MSSLDALLGDGSRCRVFSKDLAYHAWPSNARKGDVCQCGQWRVKRIRRSDGSIESERVEEIPNACSESH